MAVQLLIPTSAQCNQRRSGSPPASACSPQKPTLSCLLWKTAMSILSRRWSPFKCKALAINEGRFYSIRQHLRCSWDSYFILICPQPSQSNNASAMLFLQAVHPYTSSVKLTIKPSFKLLEILSLFLLANVIIDIMCKTCNPKSKKKKSFHWGVEPIILGRGPLTRGWNHLIGGVAL